MGISQQIGVSSLIKPGVCTSTTRPASPYQGQVIFETDTNKLLVWNSTAWVIPNQTTQNPEGLEFISTTTFTAISTAFINGCFSSTYDQYLINVNIITSATVDVRLRMRSGTNTTESGSLYDRFGYYQTGAGFTFANSGNQTSAFLMDVYAGSSERAMAKIDMFNPNNALHTNMQIQSWGSNSGSIYTWNNRVESTTQYTGFEINPDSGTVTGTISVYGYRK